MRPDPRLPRLSASFLEEDSNGWLVTFSDLVLQLFAFVMVAAVLSTGTLSGATRVPTHTARPPMERAPALPTAEQRAREAADALSLAQFDDPTPPAPKAAPAPRAVPAPIAGDASVRTEPVVASPPAFPEQSIASELEAFVVAKGLEEAVHVSVAGGGVTLSISDTIGFASGSAELLPDASPVIAEVRGLVAAWPDLAVEVSGHTDDRPLHAGAFRSNLDLALARAARVAHELAAGDAELTARIFATGYGAARPVAANDDHEGRARNRRVELRLVRQ